MPRDGAVGRSEAARDAGGDAKHAGLGPSTARLCKAAEDGDVMAIVSSEQRGEALAKAVAALTDALVLWFPPPDAMPGEAAPSSPQVSGLRFAALAALHRRAGRNVVFVTDAVAAAHRIAPPDAFAGPPLTFRPGDEAEGDALARSLESFGYFADDRVDEPGEYAVHGASIDIFPAAAASPVRIHLQDGRVGEIALYDPLTQLRGGELLDRIDIGPASEPESGSNSATLFEHLHGAAVALDPEASERRNSFIALAAESDGARKAPLLDASEWDRALAGRRLISLAREGEGRVPGFLESKRPDRAFLEALSGARQQGRRVLIAGSARDIRFFARRIEKQIGEAPRMVKLWREIEDSAPGALLAAELELDRGWSEDGILAIATADVLGSRSRSGGMAGAGNPLVQEAAAYHNGDAVIHEDHGLGILRGIETISAGEVESDAFRIEYAGQTQRLVPVEEGGRLWRYGADADAVTLDRLDGSSWQKRRAEIEATIAETARQLIDLARERDARTAPVLEPPAADYERFAAGFPYAETPDQHRAIDAVRADLAMGKPMDRLVVGDVGYGKTEVALRAAAIAALAGKQVAVVAPTTVLVRQHLDSFARRFARLGIEVAGLSRLTPPAEARRVKKGLADGSIRLVVGTSMVAGRTVSFADLGLVVIDEEQRFGAADKAKLRALGGEAHVLTLTATPIPRTLQTALVGLQALSVIATPPARRLPVRTQLAVFAPELVRSALLREKRRGGQSFLVVPRIEDMAPMAEQLARLLPDLSVRRVHGKMPAAEVDEEMVRFAAGDGDILLATNIIEAGLDIPRANTMLVWRADRFGLAQLHQLRGRVGRGRTRAHFMLLTEEGAQVAPSTVKRLRTMEALDQLGAGFAISARDLDIRGAGELLGEEQAGHVKLIGVGLYQHLLERAVRTARGEEVDDYIPELNLGVAARLPEEWIPEEDLRIDIYMRAARLSSEPDVQALADELEDRFGSIPEDAIGLLETARIRHLAREARIARVDAGPAAIALTPRPAFQGGASAAGLETKGDRLLMREATENGERRMELVARVLEALASNP